MFHNYYELQMMMKYHQRDLESFTAERRLVRAARENGRLSAVANPAKFGRAARKLAKLLEDRLGSVSPQASCRDCEEPMAS